MNTRSMKNFGVEEEEEEAAMAAATAAVMEAVMAAAEAVIATLHIPAQAVEAIVPVVVVTFAFNDAAIDVNERKTSSGEATWKQIASPQNKKGKFKPTCQTR